MDKIIFETGGGGTNTAVTFARLGWRTAFVGKVGDDIRGRAVLAQLKEEKVATKLVRIDADDPTGYSVILLSTNGERTVLVFRGASADFRPTDLKPSLLRARWFYITALAGREKYLRKILRIAKKNQVRVAINPGRAELQWGFSKLTNLLKGVDILILNKEEACTLVGYQYRRDEIVLSRICYRLPGIVVITDGPRGAFVCDNTHHYFIGTHRVKPVDTLGAGDAFGSGFLSGYLKSKGDIKFALQIGLANAERVISHWGAKAGILHHLPRRLAPVRVVTKKANF